METEIVTLTRLIDRLSRLSAAEGWRQGLNPSQLAALRYLATANRFSRSPSAVTEYLGTTKGTVSQTLRALARKGLVKRAADPVDGRSIRYDPTANGRALVGAETEVARAIATLSTKQRARLSRALPALLEAAVATRHARSFGVCRTCAHFKKKPAKAHVGADHSCRHFGEGLTSAEADHICRAHRPG